MQQLAESTSDGARRRELLTAIQTELDHLKDTLLPQIDALESAKTEIMQQLTDSTSDGTRREKLLTTIQTELDRLKNSLLPQIDALESAKTEIMQQLGATTADGTHREKKLSGLARQVEGFGRLLEAAEVDIDALASTLAEMAGDSER